MLTGLTLVITGAWCSDQTGVAMTTLAFQGTLGNEIGLYVVNISLMLFAFTTIIGWNFYAERCIIYLFGVKGVKPFRLLYIMIVASYILIVLYVDMNNVADKTAINTIWTIADLANGLMAIPNLIALFMLRKVIFSETKAFFMGKKENGISTAEKA
jgi:AGCS family alanine or glycine:cation symporter